MPKYPVVSQAEAIQGNAFPVAINTTGIAVGDVIDTTELGTTTPYTIVQADVTAGYFTVHIGIDEIASFVQFSCPASSNAICSPSWLAITSDQRQLVENTTSPPSTLAYFNPGFGIAIQEFSLSTEANDGTVTLNGQLPSTIENENYAIAVDGGRARV